MAANQEDVQEKISSPDAPPTKQMPLNLSRNPTSTAQPSIPGIIPISPEIAAQGLMAIGGCRQCARTFTDRLALIHHFVDHFPTIFYSFEPGQISSQLDPQSHSSPSLVDMGKKLGGDLSNPLSEPRSKSPPSLPVSAERQSGPSMATATATPIVVTTPLFSPLQTPIDFHRNKLPEKQSEKKKLHNMHPAMAKSIGRPFGRLPNDLPYHMCPYCCQTFLDAASYEDHVNAHKLMFNTVAESAGTSTNKCHYCDMQFSNAFLLTEHQKLHAQTCNLCNQVFMTVFDLNLHMGSHTGFSYDCKDCGRCFPSRKTLAEHNKTHRVVSSDSPLDTRPGSKEPIASSILPLPLLPTPTLSPKKTEKPTIDERPESLFLANPYFAKLMNNSPRKRRHRLARDSCSGAEESAETPKNKRHRGTRPEPRVLEVEPANFDEPVENEPEIDVESNDNPTNENQPQPDDDKDAMSNAGNLMAALLGQMQPKSQAEFMAMLFQQQNHG